MRLLRLDLLRYGHLTDIALEFPDSVGLHVVQGENEAGKSTALAAIADALFGFRNRTDFDFLHGPAQLRIGFALMAQDGTQGTFVRRKARRDTLRDAGDQIVPEEALRRFLGGASRELFEQGFGLNGVRLREGGRELLRSGGEAGESLLAGAGLLNLRAVLNRIEEEARLLVGDGRGRRHLSEAVEAWRKAQRECDECAVAPRDWKQAEAERADAVEKLARLQERTRELTAESSRLQRLRRVAPLLAQLAEAREILARLADAAHFPPDAESRFRQAMGAQRDANRDIEREAVEANRLSQQRTALSQDEPALAAQDAIDGLAAQRSSVVQAMNDLPGLEAKIAGHRAAVAEALNALGLGLTPDVARETVPSAAVRGSVQRLLNRHAALSAKAASAGENLAAALRRRHRAARDLQAAPVPPSPALLRRTVEAVREEGRLDAELARAQRAAAEAETAAGRALAALPLWNADVASLAVAKLPLPAEVENVAARLEAAKNAAHGARVERDGLLAEIAKLEEEVSRISRGEAVPTRDAVGAARQVRDRAWWLIRRMHERGTSPSTEEAGGLPESSLPDAFERLRDEADDLADRRADEAQRVSDFLAANARLGLRRERRMRGEAALADREEEAEADARAWQALWEPAGLVPAMPVVMAEWRRQCEDVLSKGQAAANARRQLCELADRRDRARQALSPLLPSPSPPEEELLATLLRRAQTTCEAAEAAEAEYHALEKALSDEEKRLPDLEDAAKGADAALRAWQDEWGPAVIALNLPADASPEVADSALGAWGRIAEAAPVWREDERRVADMTASIGAFAGQVRALAAQLSQQPSDEPPPVIVARLARRLADARKAHSDAKELAERIARHKDAASEAKRRLQAAAQDLNELRQIADVAENGEIAQAIDRARQRHAKSNEITQLEAGLLGQGDGLTEEALRAEASKIDRDTLVARLAEMEADASELGDQREKLSAQRTKAEATLAEMRTGHDAAAKAQEAEDALADAQAVAERYARVHVARVLLRSGIERFRKEQQAPLLRAAGAHFAMLTGERYVRLGVDSDTAGRVILLAVRDNGTECPVEALSDGTRDQLYLALRVAAIEAHGAAAEPLPFIADDLLVSFDDPRAASAIQLLLRLGEMTQVILFTHHEHVAKLAAEQTKVAVLQLSSPFAMITARAAE